MQINLAGNDLDTTDSRCRIVTREFISVVRGQFVLDWAGIHGAPHWARVWNNGWRIAKHTGARLDVVELFAFLHDARRMHDGRDPEHGRRAAEYAVTLQGSLFTLDDDGLGLLFAACAGHSEGLLEADITIQTCWDADRLDLARVGITPDPDKLCTDAARDTTVIAWASHKAKI